MLVHKCPTCLRFDPEHLFEASFCLRANTTVCRGEKGCVQKQQCFDCELFAICEARKAIEEDAVKE